MKSFIRPLVDSGSSYSSRSKCFWDDDNAFFSIYVL